MKVASFWMPTSHEKKIISSVVDKGNNREKEDLKFTIINFASFYEILDEKEVLLCKKYLAINPLKLGYKLPFLGYDSLSRDLIEIGNQSYIWEGETKTIPNQYLTHSVFEAVNKMISAMYEDIGKKVLIEWGHRSPARQVHIFFKFFKHYNYDFEKTISRICFPAYSEHVCAQRQAIDFITAEGIDDDFDKTAEYRWLKENAAKFGFYESYPRENNSGMMYEPWHWHYEAV